VRRSPATRDDAAFAASLNELRLLRVDRVLVAHGQPVLSDGEAAIESVLDSFAA
jgi:hypothetical protein